MTLTPKLVCHSLRKHHIITNSTYKVVKILEYYHCCRVNASILSHFVKYWQFFLMYPYYLSARICQVYPVWRSMFNFLLVKFYNKAGLL